jgi:hypothetical protein
MKKLAAATVCAALAAAVSGPALAQTADSEMRLSQAECQALWEKADASQSGALTSAQAKPYVMDFKTADANGDAKLTSSEFLQACQKGIVSDSASTGSGAGSAGESKEMAPE